MLACVVDIVDSRATLLFSMRDDIHRRLALPRVWKRVVKACVRDAEAGFRPTLAERAVLAELHQLRPTVIVDTRRAFEESERALFPLEAFRPACSPRTPMEEAYVRECFALADQRLSSSEAMIVALERALGDRLGAVEREVRAQAILDDLRGSRVLVARFRDTVRGPDLRALASGHLFGALAFHTKVLVLDIDADLRGSR